MQVAAVLMLPGHEATGIISHFLVYMHGPLASSDRWQRMMGIHNARGGPLLSASFLISPKVFLLSTNLPRKDGQKGAMQEIQFLCSQDT